MATLPVVQEAGQPTITFKVTDKQVEANFLINDPVTTDILLVGGARSGKTFIHTRAIVNRALRASESRHCIWRKHFNHAKASIGHDTFPKVLKLCFPDLAGRIAFSNEGIAMFPNGSEIWLGGLDDADRVEKILGLEFATNFLNEISQHPFHSVEVAGSRLAQQVMVDRDADFKLLPPEKQYLLPLKTLYDMNPGGKRHWSYQMFIRGVMPGTLDPLPKPEGYVWLRMNPMDNIENLSGQYFDKLNAMSRTKRKRFLEGQWADDVEGALWTDSMIEACRIPAYATRREFEFNIEPLCRVAVGVDPSGSKGKLAAKPGPDDMMKANDIGVIVAGLGQNSGKGYILEDATLNAHPAVWGKRVCDAYDRWSADLVVCESNFGGAMAEHTLHTARDSLPVKMVVSSRGKALRAEPIAALYEPNQRKVHHSGHFEELEDQMAAMMPQPIGYTGEGSPDRLDAAVFALSELILEGGYHLSNL